MSDLISRQDAIDALGEGAMVNYQAAGNDNGLIKAINVIKGLPSAKPEISLLTVKVAPDPEELERIVRKIKDAPVAALSLAQPGRKKGEWIDHSEDGFVECPFCHSVTNCDGDRDELHYCFSCGAELR